MLLRKGISQGCKVEDVDVKKGIVTGYLSTFGVKDSDNDIIVKGAFKKTLAENGVHSPRCRIKHLLDHDLTKVVGVFTELKEDEIGLYYESKAGRHTLGQDFLKMVEDGIITEHSIGFHVIKKETHSTHTELKELRLMEGSSLQCWGANEHTPVLGVKSKEEVLDLFYRLEKALRSGTYTDETFLALKEQYDSIATFFTKEATQPSNDTVPNKEEIEQKNEEVQLLEILKKFKLNERNN